MLNLRSVLGLGSAAVFLTVNTLLAFNFDVCPGATDVVMARGVCSKKLTCELPHDNLPNGKVRTCISGSNIKTLSGCLKENDPCFFVFDGVYKADHRCVSAQTPGTDQLGAAISCDN